MSTQIQVPEPNNDMSEKSHNQRHFRKLALLVGIPLLILALVAAVYFFNESTRNNASKTVDTTLNSTNTQDNPQSPTNTAGILPDQNRADLPNNNNSIPSYKARFEAINQSLLQYDEILKDLKVNGTCFSSSQEKLVSQETWTLGLNIILDETIPEISDSENSAALSQLKQLNTNYRKNIKEFIESQNIINNAWLEAKKAVFKICDGKIEQIEANCKDTAGIIDNYKKLLILENNKDLFSSLDIIIDYCKQAPNLIKADNDTKFNELNNSFQTAFEKIVSIYPNIGDKTKIIKEDQVKIKAVLNQLDK